MLGINMDDVRTTLGLIQGYLIALVVVLVLAIVITIVAVKIQKPLKGLVRGTAWMAFIIAAVIIVDMILTGPLYGIVGMALRGGGDISEDSITEASALCETIADEGFVLLKNDGLLPLGDGAKINTFGWSSTNPVYGGTGSGSLSGVQAILKLVGAAVAGSSALCLSSAALAGFGAVVQATETFGQFSTAVTSIQGPPLFIAMFAVILVTAICGSGPAAIGAALPMFKDTFAAMGVNMSALHRIAAFSATTLDTLPTNAGFIAATGLAKAETKQSYKYVGVCTVLNTTIATFVVTLLLTIAPSLA